MPVELIIGERVNNYSTDLAMDLLDTTEMKWHPRSFQNLFIESEKARTKVS